ncbi:MAG: hypothetical protein H6600_04655 [Flavobacteriales bacterium]|nr:hypothetical protein [Flavobacteriales bacterium]MCB9196741.1 hypothetical protein [Flavobacteriales bacterium]MCB9197726.1 hypothetical protein [Flavobacteriales bacterium]
MRLFGIVILILVLFSCKKESGEERNSLWLKCAINDTDYLIESNEGKGIYADSRYIIDYDNTGSDSITALLMAYCLDNNHDYVFVTIRKTLPPAFYDSISSQVEFKSYDDFRDAFPIGDVPFVTLNNDIEDGVIIEYQSDNGVRMSSGNDDFQHSNFVNCSFRITSTERFYSFRHEKDGLRVFANFEATLYNGQGDSIRIEDADCALLFVP